MIVLRGECDAGGCRRTFEISEPDMHLLLVTPRPDVPASGRSVLHMCGDVVLPSGWEARREKRGIGFRVYCNDHARTKDTP